MIYLTNFFNFFFFYTIFTVILDCFCIYIIFEKRDDGFLELNLPKLGLQRPLLWPASALPYSKAATVGEGELQFNSSFNFKP